jgi:hypothetical protein
MTLPQKMIDEVLLKYGKYAIALTGCRTTEYALTCCEYDFVILTDEQGNELLQIDDDFAEIHKMSPTLNPLGTALNLYKMQIINDPSWILSSLKQQIDENIGKAFSWYFRNKTIDALFYANRSVQAAKDGESMSSLWLKCAAYYYLEAALARSGVRPMPTHMLAQLRSIEDDTVAEGITLASRCLGLERANKSSVLRCMEGTIGLNDKIKHDHTTQIVTRKAKLLYDSAMYTDCYFYLGYIARDAVTNIASNQKALKDYSLMISIAMDLTTDQSFVLKLSDELLEACNTLLKK